MDCVIVRYGEIGLKKGNRGFFEDALTHNIKAQLDYANIKYRKVYRISGRFVVESSDTSAASVIAKVFGVESTSPARHIKSDIGSMKGEAMRLFEAADPKPESFRVTVTRLDKNIEGTSQELNTIIGAHVAIETKCKVSLKNPQLNICFDVSDKGVYSHTMRCVGQSGLPVGVSGKVVVLLSGGIDSPVAAYLCMRRGLEVTLLHFLHEDHTMEVPGKIRDIHSKLREYWCGVRLACIPTSVIEREIIMNVPGKYRILVLRRIFVRLAERLCREHNLQAVATGDNLAQVASQTLKNMTVVDGVSTLPLMRPLCFFNKQEIVDLAVKVGTYGHSVGEYVDCCSFLVPKHPSTGASEYEVVKYEPAIRDEVLDEAYGKIIWLK